MPYIETDCTVKHEGRTYEAGGAFVSDTHIRAYLGKSGVLTDWHGNKLGAWKAVSSWPIHSYLYNRMYQVEAVTADGTKYTGRSLGEGMVYNGKRKAHQ